MPLSEVVLYSCSVCGAVYARSRDDVFSNGFPLCHPKHYAEPLRDANAPNRFLPKFRADMEAISILRLLRSGGLQAHETMDVDSIGGEAWWILGAAEKHLYARVYGVSQTKRVSATTVNVERYTTFSWSKS